LAISLLAGIRIAVNRRKAKGKTADPHPQCDDVADESNVTTGKRTLITSLCIVAVLHATLYIIVYTVTYFLSNSTVVSLILATPTILVPLANKIYAPTIK
jgi:hypothetical protein